MRDRCRYAMRANDKMHVISPLTERTRCEHFVRTWAALVSNALWIRCSGRLFESGQNIRHNDFLEGIFMAGSVNKVILVG